MRQESPKLPHRWHDVTVCLIPKIPEVRLPRQLRPICLLTPGSKIVATMLADKLRGSIAAYMRCIPQFAYLPQRSANHALLRVCSHLHQARDLAFNATPSVHAKHEGAKTRSLRGGIALSLDVNKAFDALPRSYLHQALRRARIDINLIMHIHDAARMVYQVGDHQACVNLNQGVRQGCSLSPLLWAVATASLYLDLVCNLQQAQVPLGEPTLYGDDVFAAWTIRKLADLPCAIRAMGILIETLERAGLSLSLDKTVALMCLRGGAAQSQIAKVCRKDNDGNKVLQLRVFQRRIRVQVKSTHVYLGACIGYHNFELSNLQHRMKIAWGTFWRLHSILRSRALRLHTKIRLWKTCVFSALRYSLVSVGQPAQGRALVTTMINKQLRLILRSPAHLCRTTAEQVRLACRVEDPWCMLQKDLETRNRLPRLFKTAHLQDWIARIAHSYEHVPSSQREGNKAERALLHPVNSVHHYRAVCCPVCGIEFASLYTMKTHVTKEHMRNKEEVELDPLQELILDMYSDVTQRTTVHTVIPSSLQRADDHTKFVYMHALGGMSTCAHCRRQCKTWQDLAVHITSRSCRALFPDDLTTQVPAHNPNSVPAAYDTACLQKFRQGWEHGAKWIASQGEKWLYHCPWCTQWIVDTKALHIHISAKHPWLEKCFVQAKMWQFQQRKALALCSPCRYCCRAYRGHSTRHATECKSILFARMLTTQQHDAITCSAQAHDAQSRRAGEAGPSGSHHGTRHAGVQLSAEWGIAEQPPGSPVGLHKYWPRSRGTPGEVPEQRSGWQGQGGERQANLKAPAPVSRKSASAGDRNIFHWLGAVPRDHPDAYQVAAPSRGPTSHVQVVDGLGVFPLGGKAGGDHRDALRNCAVAPSEAQRSRLSEEPDESDTLSGYLAGDAQADREHSHKGGCKEGGHRHGHLRRAQGLPLPDLESQGKEGSNRRVQGSAAVGQGAGDDDRVDDVGGRQWQQVPRPARCN